MRDAPSPIPVKDRLIFALDVPTAAEAMAWVERLHGAVNFYKVGLQLFLAGGWDLVDSLAGRGLKVMLDLKFFDIPATVAKAVAQLNGRGITFATVHGYPSMLKAAAAAVEDPGLGILAVTVLTSMDQRDLASLGITTDLQELVVERARQALEAGCAGVVASAQDVPLLRRELGWDFTIVTPGIRPKREGQRHDQKRVATPGQAVANGADHLVIGRPIAESPSPLETVRGIVSEMDRALARKG